MEGTIRMLLLYRNEKRSIPKKQKNMHLPGIEPGSPAWKASIMPLDHKCFDLLKRVKKFLDFNQIIIQIIDCFSFINNVDLPALGVPIRDHTPCFLSPILVHWSTPRKNTGENRPKRRRSVPNWSRWSRPATRFPFRFSKKLDERSQRDDVLQWLLSSVLSGKQRPNKRSNTFRILFILKFNPVTTNWGLMLWGHAVSKDLVNWKELPIALTPSKRRGYLSIVFPSRTTLLL